MPISFDPEQKGWITVDLTEEEQEELVRIGAATVISQLGEHLYKHLATALSEAEDETTKKH